MTPQRLAPRELSQQAHRRLIGFLGLLLPFLLYLGAGSRPTLGLNRWELLPSVSAYYYTGAVALFVGVLFALALFLLTYPGYEGVIADRLVGFIGGCAALGVALFPTAAPDPLEEASWWTTRLRTFHYISAIVLFLAFILFAIWLFRKSSVPEDRPRPPDKRRRDRICLLCGLLMIASMLWAASSMLTQAPIFLPEAIAIIAFAVSWLVKGEAQEPVMKVFHKLTAKLK